MNRHESERGVSGFVTARGLWPHMTPDTTPHDTVPDDPPTPPPHHPVSTLDLTLLLFLAAVGLGGLLVLMSVDVAGAQVPDAAPTSAGLPAAPLVTKLLGWLRWGGLAGALASILVGAGIWGLSTTSGNGMYGTKGKTLLIGGLVGGALCGLAPALVNAMYAA